jgi:NADH-quinone oxidoreductase subunit J
MLLKAEFLAIVLVLVYVGAVMVLFLFVVMMLDINIDKLREGFWGYFPLAATIGVIIVLEMAAVLLRSFWVSESQVPAAADTLGQTKPLGKLIYTEYVYAFEIAAVILLVAIVAAVALTLRRARTASTSIRPRQSRSRHRTACAWSDEGRIHPQRADAAAAASRRQQS